MQQLSDIAFSFLSTQTCTHCQLPVTCGPVYVVNDLSILCGRCRMSAKDHYRNYAYEGLASTFLYPCKNWRNYCPVKLRWNDSLDHEHECDYVGCCTFLCSHPGAFFKGQRDIPRDEIRLVYVPDNLLEYLECVICRGYLNSSPVYIQSNGQNVCHRCVYANGNPPNCRRNHAYENFSQIFLFACTYRNRGCKERLQFGRAIWTHESRCEYGPNLPRNSTFQERSEQVRTSLRSQQEPQRLSSRQRNFQTADVHLSPNNERQFENDEQQNPVVRPKEKGLIKTHTGHIWATITPSKALFAPPDDDRPDVNKEILKSIAKKQVRQIRRADNIEQWDESGGKNWDNESVSTNTSYSYKTSGHSTPEPLDSSKKLYNPPHEYQRDFRPDSRESGYNTGPILQNNNQFHDHYPVLTPHHLDRLDSTKRLSSREVVQRESVKSNGLLISELKLKQDMIKRTHSIKGEREPHGPYKQSSNLNHIMEADRHIR